MYYYNVNGATLASLVPLEGFGPQTEPANSWRMFAAVPGDPVLGRGSFKVTHPGQLLAGHGLEGLDASRLPEAVILPLCPDKGTCLHYDPTLSASVYLENDLEQLLRQNQ